MDRIVGFIDPSTPEEYMEALMRICEETLRIWDELPDGDGKNGDLENPTKMGMFQIIQGCANYGIDCLKMKNMVNKI